MKRFTTEEMKTAIESEDKRDGGEVTYATHRVDDGADDFRFTNRNNLDDAIKQAQILHRQREKKGDVVRLSVTRVHSSSNSSSSYWRLEESGDKAGPDECIWVCED